MILVTGATGTVGRHLVLELKTARAPFRVLTRDAARAHALLGPAEFAVGDLSRPESLGAALHGVESAFLLSPVTPELPAWEAGFARAAKRAGVKRIVKLSALGADARSTAALARWHGEAENEVRGAGTAFTLLRPCAFYQNLLNSVSSIRRGVLPAPLGAARVAMVDARDVAAAAAAALAGGHDGATYALTGPAALTYAEAAAIVGKVLGRPVVYANVRPEDAQRGMLEADMPAWLVDAILGLYGQFREGAAAAVTDGVKRVTGREPIPLDRFVHDHGAAFA